MKLSIIQKEGLTSRLGKAAGLPARKIKLTALLFFLLVTCPVFPVTLISKPPEKDSTGIATIRFSLLSAMDSIAQVSASLRLLRPLDFTAGFIKSDYQGGFFLKSGYSFSWDGFATERSMTREVAVLGGYRYLKASKKLLNSFRQAEDFEEPLNGITLEFALEAIEWLNPHIGVGIFLSLGFNYWISNSTGDRLIPLMDLSFGLAF